MSVDLPSPQSPSHSVPLWQRAVTVLSSAVVGVLLFLCLQWGRPVLIPIALAVLLTFLLNPLVKLLHRRGCNQLVSAILSVSIVGVLLLSLCWTLTSQISGMLVELPRNTEKIKTKLQDLKELGSGPTRDQILKMIEEISQEFYPPSEQSNNGSVRERREEGPFMVTPETGTIIVRSERSHWLSLSQYVGSAFEVLATLAFVLVLLVFFLIERVDLRDRIVLLAGRAKLAVTSKTIEDITDRISRYIGMVALINGGFGLVLTSGLLILGVPFAPVWGFIGAILRFVPYIGPWIGAVFPITMSFATSNGWWQVISVVAFVTLVELITNNAIEPLLFGHTTGVSPTGLLVSAAFWLYLWGPVGLILSAPFAVCLVVLGKKIPQLSFLYILLGDKPALTPDYSFYQRLMLGDHQEAAALAMHRVTVAPPDNVYDELLIPVLNYSKRDVVRGYLADHDQKTILEGLQLSLQRIGEVLHASTGRSPINGDNERSSREDVTDGSDTFRILGCPTADETDAVALEMLKQLLAPRLCNFEIVSLEVLTSELVMRVRQDPPAMVFITSLPPEGTSHAVYLCKRLRKVAPDIPIVIGRLGQKRRDRHQSERLQQAGATFVTTSMIESRKIVFSRLPLVPPTVDESKSSTDAGIAPTDKIESPGRSRDIRIASVVGSEHGTL